MAAAYAVTSYPDDRTLARYRDDGPFDGSTKLGALANVGHQQARYNVANMRRAGLLSPVVWIDVEPVSLFEWSNDPVANSAVVRGVARGYTDLGYRIGTYSTQALWSTVVGDLRLGLRLRHAGKRLDDGLCRLHRRLQRTWPHRPRLTALMTLARAVQILRPHLDSAGDALRAR